MKMHRIVTRLVLVALTLIGVMGQLFAQTAPTDGTASVTQSHMRSVTNAQRKAAAEAIALRKSQAGLLTTPVAAPLPGGTPDYYNFPNYTNSPIIRKFVDLLPGLGYANRNNLGQYIPVATKIANPLFPNDDYYEIGLVDYTQQLHPDLPATPLRGYKDLAPTADGSAHYLGPLIIAQRNKPVRIKFTNMLGLGALGNLFLPVDTTTMGAGIGPLGGTEMYTQNRADLHLHGGDTPWISDGTPHQWITPAGETTSYPKGVSQQNVPDMPDPGAGSATYFYPNGQSSRLMFYHDHSYGMTRLNVYAGEAAGYLLTDPVEEDLINKNILPNLGGVYRYGIPLIIQDKTFVPDPTKLAATDPTWDTAKWGGTGSLWFPHVYVPNQNPGSPEGANPYGRWDYGPWFWPPMDPSTLLSQPTLVAPGQYAPGTPNPSMVPEAFMDTPLVNGAAYPVLPVERKAYRFRILNASNDRSLNLQLYYADPANPTEVLMVPAVPHPPTDLTWPATWPTDGRDGGVPDPTTAGPSIIQIGTEGGFLPAPAVLPNTPIGYNYNRRDIVVLNVSNHTLELGPAERADIIVDFSQVPANVNNLILYNDAPAPMPAFDTRYDYYTGNPDQTDTGGAPATLPGYGPNTRTIMQFQLSGASATAFDLNALNTSLPRAFAASQPTPVVPESQYNTAYNKTFTDTYSRIQDTSLTYTPANVTTPVTTPMLSKTIQELFELNYGRMNATLGVELPFTNFNTQTTIPFGYIDPVTEVIKNGETQLWKITHNGVDTHAIHFHLFNVQLINRVGWDGAIRPPDANELGWKDTVRMNPLEDAIVALRPKNPSAPFTLPDSIRPLDPTQPLGSTMGFYGVDPLGQPVTVTNEMTNFGNEYVWHCHLLGHEENDMMRPVIFQTAPGAPTGVTAVAGVRAATVNFIAPPTGGSPITVYKVTASPGGKTATGLTGPLTVTGLTAGTSYTFTVTATNVVGTSPASSASNSVKPALPLSAVTLKVAPAAPQTAPLPVLTSITLTATPTNGAIPEYQFRVGYQDATGWHWSVIQNYSTVATCVWMPTVPHLYTVVVWAREQGSVLNYQVTATTTYSIVAPAITAVSLAAAPLSPQRANTPITLTATVTGGYSVEYQFRVGYQDATGWHWTAPAYSTTPTYAWRPTVARVYSLVVYAREVGHTAAYDKFATISYTVQ